VRPTYSGQPLHNTGHIFFQSSSSLVHNMCIKVIEEIFLRECGHYASLGREVASQLMGEERTKKTRMNSEERKRKGKMKQEVKKDRSGCDGRKENDTMRMIKNE
jgi:hypothetical protein